MSEDGRLAALKEGVDAFNRGDPGPALAVLSADCECVVGPDLMNTGTYLGHDGYLRMITAWSEAWGRVEATIVEATEPEPDHLLVEIHTEAVGAGSGVPVAMDIFWLFQFGDGEVVRFHMYGDRETALEVAAHPRPA